MYRDSAKSKDTCSLSRAESTPFIRGMACFTIPLCKGGKDCFASVGRNNTGVLKNPVPFYRSPGFYNYI